MDRLWGVLLIIAVVGVAALLLHRIIKRIFHTTAKVGEATLSAFASGGVSLFSGDKQADLAQDYVLPLEKRKGAAALLDAFATGGVSLFVSSEEGPSKKGRRRRPVRA